MALSGCALVLLEPSKKVQNVLKGALSKAVACVNTEVELDCHLSDLLATENNQLRDVVVPLLGGKKKTLQDHDVNEKC